MSDKLTPEQRSWNMSKIKNKDTKIEVAVRKWLYSKGFRYRKNLKTLPGHPDIVLSKYKTAIFVHGCFWHRHQNCKDATTPKTRTNFWEAKFEKNIKNDQRANLELARLGWNVITIWECQVEKNFDSTMEHIIQTILANRK